MSEKLIKLIQKTSSGDWHVNMVNGTRFEITGGENFDKTIAFVFNEYDADFIEACRTEVPKLLAEMERLRKALDYINDLGSEFFTEVDESQTYSIPDSNLHKSTLQEIFVISHEAVNA
jgi:hypothetical protein